MNIDAIQAALMQGNSLPQPSDMQQVAKFTQLMQQAEPAPDDVARSIAGCAV